MNYRDCYWMLIVRYFKGKRSDSCLQVKQKQHEGMNTDGHEMANCNMNRS